MPGARKYAVSTGVGYTRSKMRRDELSNRERQKIVTRCATCGAEHAGTLASGREWMASHLEREHPELAAAAARQRRKRGPKPPRPVAQTA